MMVCSMMMFVIVVWLLISLPVWSWDVCVWDTWSNHFWSHRSVIPELLSSRHDGIEVWIYSWWFHVLTWPFWKSSISTILGYLPVTCWGPKCIVIYLRCFLVARWEPMDYVIYLEVHFGCSLRTSAYCDIFWDTLRLLVENWRILWLIRDAFSCH